MQMKKSNVVLYAMTAAFGAMVVGMNLGGISGAIDIIECEFALSSIAKGFVASSLMIGCLVGALTGGRLSDRFGRKPLMIVSALLLALSSVGCALLSGGVAALVAYRFIGGLGVGMLSAVIPVYITEISPEKMRGTLVSLYQLFVVIGILAAYTANYFFVDFAGSWRYMLGFPLAFAGLDIIFLLFLPESPLWSVQRNQKRHDARLRELFQGKMAKVVFLGCMLAFFQQITGINVVINYAPGILGKVGIAGNDPMLQTVLVGAANLFFTVIALWLCDRFGRKILLVSGCAGLVLSLGYLTYAFSIDSPSDVGILLAILAYIAFFALSLSPLMFVVTSEMYPSHIRGTAMSLSTGISWVCAFLVVQFYPWMESNLGADVTFGIFGVLCLLAGLFIHFFIPETKGKRLDEIERELGLIN
ncbi:MAG: MFS transporter [Bacteroidales bacterium]|nr:MFS transporter [Bacteroidales bacterium]